MNVSSIVEEAGESTLSFLPFSSSNALQRTAQLVQLLFLRGKFALELKLTRLQDQLAEGDVSIGQKGQRLQHFCETCILLIHNGNERR